MILVGGQSLTTWVEYYKIQLPAFDGPYLTADADFLGTKAEAEVIARYLNGRVQVPGMDDHVPNSAVIEFTGKDLLKLQIDMLTGVLGVPEADVKRLATPVQLNDWKTIHVLHPLLVLKSRCENLMQLAAKRTGNGLTQAKVACAVVTRYLEQCLADPGRQRESLKAARKIVELALSEAGIYVWKEWGIDVMGTIDPARMPGQFSRSWAYAIERVARKREIASRHG